jgi:hypothetical protein
MQHRLSPGGVTQATLPDATLGSGASSDGDPHHSFTARRSSGAARPVDRQLTSEQDWDLCEKNQAGVNSSAFTLGSYSTKREYNVIRCTAWYLHAIARPEHPEGSQCGEESMSFALSAGPLN